MTPYGSAFITYREIYNPLFQWRDQDEGILKLIGKRIVTTFAILPLPITLITETIYHVAMFIFCAFKKSMRESNRHFDLSVNSFVLTILSPIEVLRRLILNIFYTQISPAKYT